MLQHHTMRLGLSGALLALGSLAPLSCGDDDDSSPDARRPPDASQALDANRPPDANRLPDASQALDASRPPDGGGSTDGGDPGDAAVANCDPAMDLHEPNDSAGTAPLVAPNFTSDDPSSAIYGIWFFDACLGHGNQDWYRIDSSQLQWALNDDYEGIASLRLRTILSGTGVCAPGCEEPLLPDTPENTVTVSVYRASDMAQLLTNTSTRGLVKVQGYDESFDEDLLISVSGPSEALYSYRFSVYLDLTNSEDECEC